MSQPARTDRSKWNYLLLVPIVLPLFTFIYNRETPMLFGWPFFFWFQLLFAPLAVLCTVLAMYLGKRGYRSRKKA
jgi:hypothetical protein